MSRVIYNVEGLFTGPSGHNFLSYIGERPHDDYSNPLLTHNLIKQIDRVQSFSYDINIPHTQINQLNTRSVLGRPIINPPQVDFSFRYLVADVSNESKLGLYVNYPQYERAGEGSSSYDLNGTPFYLITQGILYYPVLSTRKSIKIIITKQESMIRFSPLELIEIGKTFT